LAFIEPYGGERRSAEPLFEMERTLFEEIERLKALGEPADDLLKEMGAASGDLHAFLEECKPRSP
jgi:hypothetical protein